MLKELDDAGRRLGAGETSCLEKLDGVSDGFLCLMDGIHMSKTTEVEKWYRCNGGGFP